MKQLLLCCLPLFFFSCNATKDAQSQAAAYQTKAETVEQELNSVKGQLATVYDKNKALKADAEELSYTNQKLAEENKLLMEQLQSVTTEMQESSDDYGVWFRVQIGAFGQYKVDPNVATTDELSIEEQEQMQKFSLGRFRTYSDAKDLQKHLMSIGIIDAWVVSYKDGVRVPVESVINTTN